MQCVFSGLALDRRDTLAEPEGYPARLQAALQQCREMLAKRAGSDPDAARVRPLISPAPPLAQAVSEEHPLYATTEQARHAPDDGL